MREKLGNIYGLRDASILKLKFDGEVLEDGQTPEEVDMEDEYMVDVSVRASRQSQDHFLSTIPVSGKLLY